MPLVQEVQAATAIEDEEILEKVLLAADAAFNNKVAQIGEDNFTHFERMVLAAKYRQPLA